MSTVFGTNGDDYLEYGSSGAGFTIFGGDGNDYINTGGNNDFLYGGAGDDSMWGGTQTNFLDGGDGVDTLMFVTSLADFGSWTQPMFWRLDLTTAQIHPTYYPPDGEVNTLLNFENIVLVNGANDHLTGSGGNNFLSAIQGDDTLIGLDGSDILVGDVGNDSLDGGAGNDFLYGGVGADALFGGLGHDTLRGGGGNDRLYGFSGNDVLNGGTGSDTLIGGKGTDVALGGLDFVKDVFLFTSAFDSWIGYPVDTIENFISGIDEIDLSGIDANTLSSGNQTFGFSGTLSSAFSVWFRVEGSNLTVNADVSGDGVADFMISVHSSVSLMEDDFVL